MTTRKIGAGLATFVVANNMIGSGFFLLPATLASSGAVTVFSWVIGTVLALLLGGAFARLARDYPDLQSADDYVRPSLGRDASFLASSLYWFSSWIGNNAIAVAAFGYLVLVLVQAGLPLDAANPTVQVGGQIVLIWLMFAINLLGPRPVAKFQSLCVVFGLVPVAFVLLFGWGHFDRGIYDASWNVTGESDASVVFGSLGTIFWAFVGLETGAMIAGVVKDPDRDIPIATAGGILIAGIVYILSSVLVMGIVPAEQLAGSSAPFALVAAEVFGPWAAIAIAAAAALKATGTLGGWMLVTGETGARAAQHGYLPRIFGRLNARGAAATGLLIIATAMSAIAFLTLSPNVSQQFGLIIGIVVNLVVLAYAAAGLSLVVGTRERRPTTMDRLLGGGALLACALLLWSTSATMLLGLMVAMLAAWSLYRLLGRRRTHPPERPT
jgi:amino acid transporter